MTNKKLYLSTVVAATGLLATTGTNAQASQALFDDAPAPNAPAPVAPAAPAPVAPVAPAPAPAQPVVVQAPQPAQPGVIAQPTQPTPALVPSTSASDLRATSNNSSVAAPDASASVSQVNVQQNRSFNFGSYRQEQAYQIYSDVRCPSPSLYANTGYGHAGGGNFDGFSGGGFDQFQVQAGITVPLGNGGCKERQAARAQSDLERHQSKLAESCISYAERGVTFSEDSTLAIAEFCRDLGIVAQAPEPQHAPDLHRHEPQVIVPPAPLPRLAPPPAPDPEIAPAPIRGLW